MKLHKHYEEIIAWANGAEIQVQTYEGRWTDTKYPSWNAEAYRIKPEPKPDVVAYGKAVWDDAKLGPAAAERVKNSWTWFSAGRSGQDNIKCTFDGETGKLKKVEIVNE